MTVAAQQPSNGVWRWIAAIMLAIMLAGLPGVVQALRAPTREEVNFIRERQVQVLERLSALEVQVQKNQDLLAELQDQLQRHEADTTNRR